MTFLVTDAYCQRGSEGELGISAVGERGCAAVRNDGSWQKADLRPKYANNL